MKVEIINKSNHNLPAYETEGSAGMDLKANTDAVIELKPLERQLIPTGLFVAIPVGYEAQIRPRSGLASKKGITVINTPGTIDADFRGELKVCLINLSNEPYFVQPGDRIAQMVVCPVAHVEWKEVTELPSTERGEGGFGHTGIK